MSKKTNVLSLCFVRHLSNIIEIKIGLRQGNPISLVLFNIALEYCYDSGIDVSSCRCQTTSTMKHTREKAWPQVFKNRALGQKTICDSEVSDELTKIDTV